MYYSLFEHYEMIDEGISDRLASIGSNISQGTQHAIGALARNPKVTAVAGGALTLAPQVASMLGYLDPSTAGALTTLGSINSIGAQAAAASKIATANSNNIVTRNSNLVNAASNLAKSVTPADSNMATAMNKYKAVTQDIIGLAKDGVASATNFANNIRRTTGNTLSSIGI